MRILRAVPALIFGLMFSGGGVFFLSETALPVWQDWRAMQQWQPAEAYLTSVQGGENYTQAHYQYQFNGITFEGDRAYVASFNDNIGSYHEDFHAWLNARLRADEPVTVWVNPANPAQAVIDRDMRWGLFALMTGFCSVFILVGLVVCYAGITSSSKTGKSSPPSLSALRKEWDLKRQTPGFNLDFMDYSRQRREGLGQDGKTDSNNTDWQTRKGWETPSIRSGAKAGFIGMWGFAIVWNGVSAPLFWLLPEEAAEGNYPALVGLLFPLIGAILIYKTVAMTGEYRRFGRVLLEMDPYPGAIGGHVGGRIVVPKLAYSTASASEAQLSVRLECVYSYVSGSGDNRSRRESIKWAEQGKPQVENTGQGVSLAFRFDVPKDLPEADVEQTGAYHRWRLSIEAQIEGIDLSRQYNIPVFPTGKTSRSVHHDVSAQVLKERIQESEAAKAAIAQGNFALPGLSRAMRFSDEGGEIRMVFPMFRNKVLTVFAAVFAGGFGFGSYMMLGTALKGGAFGLFTGLFSVPFVLVALVASMATVYLPLNNLRVHIRGSQISTLRRLLFIPVVWRRLSSSELSHLAIKRTGSTGQGVDKIEHFKLLAHVRSGGTVTLAEDLDGEDISGHFRDYLARRLNVESSPDVPISARLSSA